MAETKEVSAGAPGGLASATDKLRQVATWMLGAFAAVGVIFAAGVSLANVGKLSLDDPSRLLAAAIGVTLTVIAIIWAVAATAKVTANSRVSLALLATNSEFTEIRTTLESEPGTLGTYTTVGQLVEDLSQLRKSVREADAEYAAAYANLVDPATRSNQETYKAAEALLTDTKGTLGIRQHQLEMAELVRANLLEIAAFTRVRKTFDSTKVQVAIATAIAAVGIAIFAWGANPPESTKIEAGELVPKTPSEVTVVFANPDDATLQRRLGADCDLTAGVSAVAMTVTGDTYRVATLLTETCGSIWLTVTPSVGTVIPRVADAPASQEPTS